MVGFPHAIFEYFVLISFRVFSNSDSDRSVDRYVAVLRRNSISLSDIAHLILSRLAIASKSLSAATFSSVTFLSVPPHVNTRDFHRNGHTASVQSHFSISSILSTTTCDSCFCFAVGGNSHALKLAQSLSVSQFSLRVCFPCLSSLATLPRTAMSLSVNPCGTCVHTGALLNDTLSEILYVLV